MPLNRDEIMRCPIWKVLGVTECDNCDTVVQCWEEEAELPKEVGLNVLEECLGRKKGITES